MSWKVKVPFVQIEFIRDQVAGKINILESVIIKISDSYTTAIVDIGNIQHIHRIRLNDLVIEMDPGMIGGNCLEQRIFRMTSGE